MQFSTVILSDAIVLGLPIAQWRYPEMIEPELWFFLDLVAETQLQLAVRGFFSRGAVALGELHMDRNYVFGKALIRAYELERDCAIKPRVVLDQDVKRLVQHHLTFYGRHVDSVTHLWDVLVDDDGQFVVNYLRHAGYRDYGYGVRMLRVHAMRVCKSLSESDGKGYHSKFAWLSGYHDFVIDRCVVRSEEFCRSPSELDQLRLLRHAGSVRLMSAVDMLRIPQPA